MRAERMLRLFLLGAVASLLFLVKQASCSGRVVSALLVQFCAGQISTATVPMLSASVPAFQAPNPAVLNIAQKSVVGVEVVRPGNQTVRGSGFVVAGHSCVVTNHHVVENASQIRVKLTDGRMVQIFELAEYPELDLALLKLPIPNGPQGLNLRQDLPRIGEDVYALGNPLGLLGTVTNGIVSSVRTMAEIAQVMNVADPELQPTAYWIQTTAPAAEGSSGGPLIDKSGNVVGVVTFGIVRGQGLNFALASVEVADKLASPAYHRLSPPLPPPPKPPSRPPSQPPKPRVPFGRPPSPAGLFPPINVGEYTIRPEMVRIDMDTLSAAKNGKGLYFRAKAPDGSIIVAAGFFRDKLNGPTFLFHPNGVVAVNANYKNARKDGTLVIRGEDGLPILLAQYTYGRKNGLVVMFRNGLPEWAEVWDRNNCTAEYFIDWSSGNPVAIPFAEIADKAKAEKAQKCMQEVQELLKVWEEEEDNLRRTLAKWFWETDEKIRKQRAAAIGVQKRAAMLAKIEAEASARASAVLGSIEATKRRLGL